MLVFLLPFGVAQSRHLRDRSLGTRGVFLFSSPAVGILCSRTGNSDGSKAIGNAPLIGAIRRSRQIQVRMEVRSCIFHVNLALHSLEDAYTCSLPHTHGQAARSESKLKNGPSAKATVAREVG